MTGTDFKKGHIDWDGCWYVDEDRYHVDPYILLQPDDVLITEDGTIGKIAIVKGLPAPATLNSGIFVTRPLRSLYVRDFMFWVLNSDLFPEFIKYSKVGTTIDHLYQKIFERFCYPLPPKDEQLSIAAYLDNACRAIDGAIEAKRKQLDTSRTCVSRSFTRQSLVVSMTRLR